jgi:hypothetical protein
MRVSEGNNGLSSVCSGSRQNENGIQVCQRAGLKTHGPGPPID